MSESQPRSSPYAKKEPEGTAFFDDGREIALLHYIYGLPNLEEIRGFPQKVIEAINEYAKTKYLMSVGPWKGKVVSDLILERRPEVMVELGGYTGYSAILFGDAVRQAGGKRFYSLERNPEFAAVTSSLVDLAGLSDVVRVEVGPADTSLVRLHKNGTLKTVDMVFIDHYKPAYLPNIQLMESLGLVVPGTLICADNCIKPGAPAYVAYMRRSVKEKRDNLKAGRSKGYDVNGIPDRAVNQYKNKIGEEIINVDMDGNPNLIYDSHIVNSWEPSGEPDGVEVSRCVGVEA